MKNFIRSLMLLVGIMGLVGCASQGVVLPDGSYFHAATTGDGPDRSGTVFGIYKQTGEKDASGKPVLEKVVSQLSIGPTIAGQVLVGVTQGTGVALIQQRTAVKVAGKNACNGPTCGNGTIVINDGRAVAGSSAGSTANSAVDVLIESGCLAGGAC